LGVPGPLSQFVVLKDAKAYGIGWGRANHAGKGDSDVHRAVVAENYGANPPRCDEADMDGNPHYIGFECENMGDGEDPWPQEQYAIAVKWAAGLCRKHGWSEKSVAGHKEVQPGKIDPTFDMDDFRQAVKVQLGKLPGEVIVTPTPTKPKVDLSRLVSAAKTDPGAAQGHVTYMAGTNIVENALVREGLLAKTYAGDGSFGSTTVAAYKKWQQKLGYTGSDADGIPGSTSLKKLGAKYGFDVVA